jgi:hypothetical protein
MNKGYLGNIPTTKRGLINPSDARFYYLKDENSHHPRVTICLGNDNGKPVRGIAICSLDDKLDKNEGRKLAYIRMKNAKRTKQSNEAIDLNHLNEILNKLKLADKVHLSRVNCKSEYNTRILSESEKRLIEDL